MANPEVADESSHLRDKQRWQSDIEPTLKRWQHGIANRDLELIGSAFAEDVLFQGMRPQPVRGRDAVREYYEARPVPLTVEYELAAFRALGTKSAIAYLRATFHPGGRDDLQTFITMLLERRLDGWQITHYHVSQLVA